MDKAQSRQSSIPSLQSSKLGLPHPLGRRQVCTPPPLVREGGSAVACGSGGGEAQFQRGDRHCGSLGICICTL
jgi:hypothetical protein